MPDQAAGQNLLSAKRLTGCKIKDQPEDIATPYKILKKKGPRPFKIYRSDTGKLVGTSKTREKAEACIRAREMGKHHPEAMRRRPKLRSKGET